MARSRYSRLQILAHAVGGIQDLLTPAELSAWDGARKQLLPVAKDQVSNLRSLGGGIAN